MTEQTKSPDERAVTKAELAAPWERPHTLPSSPQFPSCEPGPADTALSLLGVAAAVDAAAVAALAATRTPECTPAAVVAPVGAGCTAAPAL